MIKRNTMLNYIPARLISDHREYNAQPLRRKIYFHISEFLTDLDEKNDTEGFENAQTADEFWNKIQHKLVETGYIHPSLRMFWAKNFLNGLPHRKLH